MQRDYASHQARYWNNETQRLRDQLRNDGVNATDLDEVLRAVAMARTSATTATTAAPPPTATSEKARDSRWRRERLLMAFRISPSA